MEKIKDLPTRLWHASKTLELGWSRDTLVAQIKGKSHTRQGAAVSNFGNRLPAVHAELASGLLKDPYMFDFLTMEEHFHERELETGLLEPQFYDYLFRCGICFTEFRRYSRGIMDMRLRLYFEDFGQLRMPFHRSDWRRAFIKFRELLGQGRDLRRR